MLWEMTWFLDDTIPVLDIWYGGIAGWRYLIFFDGVIPSGNHELMSICIIEIVWFWHRSSVFCASAFFFFGQLGEFLLTVPISNQSHTHTRPTAAKWGDNSMFDSRMTFSTGYIHEKVRRGKQIMWRNTFLWSTFRATLVRFTSFRKMAIITSEAIHLDLCEMTCPIRWPWAALIRSPCYPGRYVLAAFGQPGCLTPPNAAGASNPKMKAGMPWLQWESILAPVMMARWLMDA